MYNIKQKLQYSGLYCNLWEHKAKIIGFAEILNESITKGKHFSCILKNEKEFPIMTCWGKAIKDKEQQMHRKEVKQQVEKNQPSIYIKA